MSARAANALGFLACVGLLAYAYYAQFVMHLEPCPLCIFQRIGVLAIGVAFALAAAHDPGVSGRRVYAGLIALAAEIGEAAWNNVPPEEWKVKSLMDKLNNDIKKLDDSVKQYRDFTKQRDDAVNGINKLVNSYNTRLETLYSEHYRDFENLSVGHYLSVAPPVPLGPTLDTPGAKGSPPHVDNPVLPPDPLAGQPQPRTYQEEEEAAKEFWSAAFTGLAGPH